MIYTPSNGDVLTCTLTSSLMCVSGNQITSNPITMVVSSVLTPTITIAASENPFCQGSTVIFNSTISNGGNGPVYQWQKNGITSGTGSLYNYVPLDGDYITCRITSSLGCASPNPVTSNPILMIRNQSTPVSVSIAVSENPVCSGSTVTFTATPANGGTAPSYQWKVNGISKGGNSAAFTYSPVIGGEIVTCTIISNAVCVSGNPAISNSITLVTSSSPTPGIVISTLTNPFCAGTSVAFSAISTNGGSSPTYLWKVNNLPVGSNSPMFTYPALNGDIVTCQMTSSAACIAGTVVVSDPPITMVASDNLPLGIMITESANPVCLGTAVHYTATSVNGGANPSYQWRVNSINKGTNNPVFIYVPVNTDAVTCKLTTSLVCASPQQKTSDPITMIVEQSQPVGISIAASANPVCQGSPVTLTATPANGGTTPTYQWRVNGVNIGATGPLYSYTPSNGDVVTATLISNAYCVSGNPAVSNPVALVVGSEQPVNITIAASENPFCAGSQIIYQATPTNGGANPTYVWRVNGIVKGTNNPVFQYSPVAGDQITCVLTSNQTCVSNNPATSNTINMVVTTLMPVGVTITASNTTLCAGTLIQFTATVTNGGTSPTYNWKVNGISKGTNFPIYQYPPVNGDVVTCIVSSNLTCATNNPATSNAITMNVIPSAPVSISIVESLNPCCQGTSVTYTATATNAGPDPLYRWKVNGTIILGSGSPVFTYIPINGDAVLCRLTSDQECATNNPANSNSIIMTVLPYGIIGVSITASGNPVCQGTLVTYTATPENGGSLPSYQWKVNGLNTGSNSTTFSYTPVQGDVIVCVMTSSASCVLNNTTTSNPITMTVSPLLPVSVYIVSSSNPVCQGTVTLNATPLNGGPFPVYQWKVNGNNVGTGNPVFTYAPVEGDVVRCSMTSNAACIQGNPANSNEVTLNVVQSMPVSVTVTPSSMPSCQGETITYTATPVNGGANPIYQ